MYDDHICWAGSLNFETEINGSKINFGLSVWGFIWIHGTKLMHTNYSENVDLISVRNSIREMNGETYFFHILHLKNVQTKI